MKLDFSNLSEAQRHAVTTTEGAVLVFAGAGSGKTGVLTRRFAYLVQECGVPAYRILAITFTNKAANEMKARIESFIEQDCSKLYISTFHSLCAKLLRYDADKLGYTNSFTIYDTSDATSLIKKCLSELNLDVKAFAPKMCLSKISAAKNLAGKMSADEYFETLDSSYSRELSRIFERYQSSLKAQNAMDFDDLLLNMLKLLRDFPEVRNFYQSKFRYIMVDEYQDTNSVQYSLVKIFGTAHGNVFAVGDDDQSIYSWRGADISNILNFERDFPNSKIIKLEQNYRSHNKILNAANAVISKCSTRKSKTLWSGRDDGELPQNVTCPNEYAEAEFIARKIADNVKNGGQYVDNAVLYRANAQSRIIEEKLRAFGIPYRVYGGISFYDRKEVKDIIAYLTVIENPNADTALLRIINSPKRGIGDTTVAQLLQIAEGKSIVEILFSGELDGKLAQKLTAFSAFLRELKQRRATLSVPKLIEEILEITGYREMLEADEEAAARLENVGELLNAAYEHERSSDEPTLGDFLSGISLFSDLDTMSDGGGVSLMTLHSAKGLEFDTVFIIGLEERVFPSYMSLQEDKLDEERRLCYVGITRAKNTLFMTNCEQRRSFSNVDMNPPSRFLDDIPEDAICRSKPKKVGLDFSARNDNRSSSTLQNQSTFGFRNFSKTPAFTQEKKITSGFETGQTVEHPKFGHGLIEEITGAGEEKIALIAFDEGEKKMFLSYAPLTIVHVTGE